MKIQIKITGIEISIDTDEPTQTHAVVENTVQALEAAVQPLLATTVQPKRTVRTAKATPEPAATPAVVEPQAATVIPAATNGHSSNTEITVEPAKKRLSFEEFDRMVRAEMKRLAPSPGQMPSHSIWNELRNSALPTLGAVISRYDCVDLNGLAKELGMNPPLGKPGPKPEPAA